MKKPRRKFVPVDSIRLVPEFYGRCNPVADWKVVTKYMEAMEVGSEFPPIKIHDDGDGTYTLLDGNHRHAATKKLKEAKIAAMVYSGLSDKEKFILAVEDNVRSAEPLSPQDRTRAASILKNKFKLPQGQLSAMLGLKTVTMSRWMDTRMPSSGGDIPLKAAVRSAKATVHEPRAMESQRGIAVSSFHECCEQMLMLLSSGVIDPSDEHVSATVNKLLQAFYQAGFESPLVDAA